MGKVGNILEKKHRIGDAVTATMLQRLKRMEQAETTEQNLRISMKQTSKGFWYCEMTARGNTIDEIKQRFEELKKYALMQLDCLNGGSK